MHGRTILNGTIQQKHNHRDFQCSKYEAGINTWFLILGICYMQGRTFTTGEK